MTIWSKNDAIYMPDDLRQEYRKLIVFPWQQWLCERASVLRYMYIALLVRNMLWGENLLHLQPQQYTRKKTASHSLKNTYFVCCHAVYKNQKPIYKTIRACSFMLA
jgi:hypothetical protein